MADIKNVIGKYMGKTLTQDTENWKKYKGVFEVEGKSWNFTFFTPWTKKDGTEKKGSNPEKMIEGQNYKIGYTEYLTEGHDFPSKTAISFFSHEGEVPANVVSPKVEGTNDLIKTAATNTLMIDTYFKLKKKEEQNINHFIGTMIRTLDEKLIQPLIDEFNKRTKPEEKPVAEEPPELKE